MQLLLPSSTNWSKSLTTKLGTLTTHFVFSDDAVAWLIESSEVVQHFSKLAALFADSFRGNLSNEWQGRAIDNVG
jgi:3-oxoacyl-[acyl-carrier-protein] synthase III